MGTCETQDQRPEDIIRVQNHFYVLANSALVEQRTRVLKQGDCFGVFDVHGDIHPIGLGSQGLYYGATRFLSTYELRLSSARLALLSSTIKTDSSHFIVDLMNPTFRDEKARVVPQGAIHLFRSKFLWEGVCYERIRVENFLNTEISARLSLHFASDYADIFEVRGLRRERRGSPRPPRVGRRSVVLGYDGLDGISRQTRLLFRPRPETLTSDRADFKIDLGPKERKTIYITLGTVVEAPSPRVHYLTAKSKAARFLREARQDDVSIRSSNAVFNEWVKRSQSDLHLMVTRTAHGPYPYAGVPWFNTVFGRDGIITALQSLWINPDIAKGVLGYLSAMQAKEDSPSQDADPGKILHEVRSGEMVAVGDVPFQRYYGSADATPLFVVLAAEYFERTGDSEFIRGIWPNIQNAVHWLDAYGDLDGDGFIEYRRRADRGLSNQGWKDSGDSISHSDGKLAEGAIALCEVQAYAYAALKSGARLASAFNDKERATAWEQRAEILRQSFEEKFWSEELSTYALALDGEKRRCEVRSSNAGHCLFSGIASAERAKKVARTLMHPDLYSGWGIRTLGTSERNFNPMSYHNGSVWPHDTAMIAEGFSRYGFKGPALKLFNSLLDASVFMDLCRLPELFCGFDRRIGEGPTLYPVACSPQAWAAGSVFMLLKSVLGLTLHGLSSQVHFHYPVLPRSLEWLQIRKLKVGGGEVDILVTRQRGDVSVTLLRREGEVEVAILK